MNDRFYVSASALNRLTRVARVTTLRNDFADLTEDEDKLIFAYDATLRADDVCAVLECSRDELEALDVPVVKVGDAVRYSAQMVRTFIETALREQSERAYTQCGEVTR
jgi:hypothetical protein